MSNPAVEIRVRIVEWDELMPEEADRILTARRDLAFEVGKIIKREIENEQTAADPKPVES